MLIYFSFLGGRFLICILILVNYVLPIYTNSRFISNGMKVGQRLYRANQEFRRDNNVLREDINGRHSCVCFGLRHMHLINEEID